MIHSIFKQAEFRNFGRLINGPVAVFELVGAYSKTEFDKVVRDTQVWCIKAKFDGLWKVSRFVAKERLHDHWHPSNPSATNELDGHTQLHVAFYDEGDATRFKLSWCN